MAVVAGESYFSCFRRGSCFVRDCFNNVRYWMIERLGCLFGWTNYQLLSLLELLLQDVGCSVVRFACYFRYSVQDTVRFK